MASLADKRFLVADDPNIKRVRARGRGRQKFGRVHLTRALNSRAQDIVCLIMQYLQDEGYTTSFLTMQDETKIKLAEKQTQRSYFKRMRKAILGASLPCVRRCSRSAKK